MAMHRSVSGLFVGLLLTFTGVAHAKTVSIDFTKVPAVSNGLTQVNTDRSADGFTTIVTRADIPTAKTGGSSSAQYLYLKISDATFKTGLKSVWATVTYFDRGTDKFTLEYDGQSSSTDSVGGNANYQYDEEDFRTRTWHLTGFKLAGGQEGGADLRINDGGSNPVFIAKVELSDTDPLFAHIPYAATAPTIDGKIDAGEWDKAYKVTVNDPHNDGIQPSNMLAKSPEFSGTYSFTYDETNLYVLGQVVDATPRLNDTSDGIAYYNGDALEFFVGLDETDPERTSFGPKDFQLGIGLGAKPGWSVLTSPALSTKTLDPIGNNIAVTNSSNGYVFELKIPWSTLGVTVTQGQAISYYLFADNSTVTPSAQEVALGPTGFVGPSNHPSGWIKGMLDKK